MTENDSPKCTCPCIDCIEGNHCGGEFWWPDEPIDPGTGEPIIEPQLIGACEYIPWDALIPDEFHHMDYDGMDCEDDDNGYFECEQDGWAE